MARPTRSAKRKRPDDDHEPAPQKQLRHLDKQHAAAILDVLAMLDSQGLLDRVFPVHAHPTRSAALRTLLAEQQPLDVLRAAVRHLQPISAVPRATLSPTAAQQHRFCALATDLLDQASVPVLLDHASASASPACPRPLKYALVQHLPNQDYWSSLTALPLNTLPTAHAELVAVLPTPSAQPDPRPTLAAYAAAPSPQSIKPLPQQRTVTTGAFLDFGPWASFAPTFDHDGEVVARNELALALYASHRVRRIAAAREPPDVQDPPPRPARAPVDLESELHELLPPEDAAAVKSALDVLQLEAAVQELLDRNRAALLRLEHLQTERMIADAPVEEGSEEWDTAQGILDTLTVLASLRPRSTGAKTIVPPPPILHRLHRTLAVAPSPGWHGTLPAARPAALADDTTFKKSSRAVPPPPAATPTPTPAAAPAVTAPVALPYSGYTYAYGQQGQAQP
ncbi:hypothetical protein C0993_007726 [Termitomyces sp. T159_Od127]|nr:hypothetical protein C0993_007726 [Termitomyces sp. T159_Od127]